MYIIEYKLQSIILQSIYNFTRCYFVQNSFVNRECFYSGTYVSVRILYQFLQTNGNCTIQR